MKIVFVVIGMYSGPYSADSWVSSVFDSEDKDYAYIFEMEEVGIREFWAGINLKDSFLQFVRNGVNGFSTGIFMNEGLSARGKDSFL